MASERPRQVATATLVRILIVGYPCVTEGCAGAAGEERMSGCYVVANPGAPFKTIFKVNCAIAVPRVENEKPVVNRASSGLRRASGLRKFCISYLPRDF